MVQHGYTVIVPSANAPRQQQEHSAKASTTPAVRASHILLVTDSYSLAISRSPHGTACFVQPTDLTALFYRARRHVLLVSSFKVSGPLVLSVAINERFR